MPAQDLTITLNASGPSPSGEPASNGDQVTFTNGMNVSTTLTLPLCFAGQQPTTVVIGVSGSSGPYTVAGNPNKSYPYTYTSPSPTQTDKGGTIDVS